ncbi:MAG TPA: HAMP domain-containing protein, partial [Stellaceae bacterium]|nr:HAMP domain-containing protein [Stellaceae bacterium]
MPSRANLSIRTILGLLIGTTGLLLVVLSAFALFEAASHHAGARRVAASTITSQQLFKSMLALRLERGGIIGGLLSEAPIDSKSEADNLSNRGISETAYVDSIQSLTELDLPELASAISGLKAAHDAVVSLRTKADVAVRQPRSAREPAIVQDWPKTTQSLLDAILATAGPLEEALKLFDPKVDHFLAIKQAAWTTRLNLGLMALRLQAAVALNKPLTPADTLIWYQDRAHAAAAWSIVTTAAARRDAPAALVDSVAKSNVNFVGRLADFQQAIVDAFVAGRKVDVSFVDLQRSNTEGTTLANVVLDTAMDKMVATADAEAAQATRQMSLNAVVLLVALGLSVAGFLVVRRRVSRPILALTATIEHLAQQDFSVEIPAKTRDDEVGRMQTALLVL